VGILGEKLRGEEHFIDKPAHRFPVDAGYSQFDLARCGHDVLDAVGEYKSAGLKGGGKKTIAFDVSLAELNEKQFPGHAANHQGNIRSRYLRNTCKSPGLARKPNTKK
jgi:hypothetical protein